MAEAHQAVAFQFTVTPEGVDFQLSREALKHVCLSGINSWKKRLIRIKNGILRGVYPGSPTSWLAVVMATMGSSYCNVDISMGMICFVRKYIPEGCRPYLTLQSRTLISMGIFSTGVWVTGIFLFRQTLKMLLTYHGWMFELHGQTSRITKIWAICVRLLSNRRPMLYSFQTSLPKLPVPKVAATLKRYLESVKPLLDDEEYYRMEVLAKEFQEKTAPRLQKYLVLKSWWATNYVSDWWEEYIYLRGRNPIMVNSNYYVMVPDRPFLLFNTMPPPQPGWVIGHVSCLLPETPFELFSTSSTCSHPSEAESTAMSFLRLGVHIRRVGME